jgi:integral membrane sensor domain MASE1
MSWLEIGKIAAIVVVVAMLIWVSIRFGVKQAFVLLTLIFYFLVSGIIGETSISAHSKRSEAQARAFRNYTILAGFVLLACTLAFLAFCLLRKTFNF